MKEVWKVVHLAQDVSLVITLTRFRMPNYAFMPGRKSRDAMQAADQRDVMYDSTVSGLTYYDHSRDHEAPLGPM